MLTSLQQRLELLEIQCARFGFSTAPEFETEIGELRTKLIPALREELLAQPEKIDLDKLHRQVIQADEALADAEAHWAPVRFVNREAELEQILDTTSSGSHFVIQAPTGFGKSFLLRRAKHKFKEHGWLVALVDLTNVPGGDLSQTYVLNAIYAQTLTGVQGLAFDPNRLDAVDVVSGRLSAIDRPVALLLDHLDAINDRAFVPWLRDELIPAVRLAMISVQGGKFRCVVAGRSIGREWFRSTAKFEFSASAQQIPYTAISLKPFTLNAVAYAARQLYNAQSSGQATNGNRTEPKWDVVYRVAVGTQSIAGGHPRATIALLEYLMAEFSLVPRPGYFESNRGDLYARHVSPVCGALLDDLPTDLRDFFPYLSLLRCYNSAIVQAVLQWAQERHGIGADTPLDENKVMQRLTVHRLVVYREGGMLFGDGVMRRVVAYGTWLDHPDLARSLNQVALELYRRWLGSPPQPDIGFYRAIIVEYLYHWAMSLDDSASPEQTLALVKQEVLKSVQRFEERCANEIEFPYALVSSLVREIIEDEELVLQLMRILHGETNAEIREALLTFLSGLANVSGRITE